MIDDDRVLRTSLTGIVGRIGPRNLPGPRQGLCNVTLLADDDGAVRGSVRTAQVLEAAERGVV